MSDQHAINEQYLSDLLDDCADPGAVEQVLSNEQDCEAWYRYNLVSSVLKNEQSAFTDYEFTQSIAAQIAEEPAIIARPKKASASQQFWKRTGGGFAVAASVAFAMVFSVQVFNASTDATGEMATATGQAALPAVDKSLPRIVTAAEAEEQARLDEIQTILSNMSNNPNLYEQKVGGEVIYSTIIKNAPLDKSDAESDKDEENKEFLETSDQ